MEKGLVHIYCGDGKGKTTAATGLALRCCGRGGRVLFCQFLKDGSSGEIAALREVRGITLGDFADSIKFSFCMTEEERVKAAEFYGSMLQKIVDLSKAEYFDMIVLDEGAGAAALGFISLERLVAFVKNKPKNTELVITGRQPPKELLDLADYVTEMKKNKHPFDSGIRARKMIEY